MIHKKELVRRIFDILHSAPVELAFRQLRDGCLSSSVREELELACWEIREVEKVLGLKGPANVNQKKAYH